MKHELKVGQKIRFSGPTTKSNGEISNEQLACIYDISGEFLEITTHDLGYNLGRIHRRQVTHVFVKKKKESKYPKEIWVNFYTGGACVAHLSKENADANCSNVRLHGKATRYVLAKGQE